MTPRLDGRTEAERVRAPMLLALVCDAQPSNARDEPMKRRVGMDGRVKWFLLDPLT